MNKDKLVTVQEAAEGLLSGKTILYPTDTIWGIGCDASNEKAIKAIEEMKNRPNNKTFILLVESVPMLERYVKHIPDVAYDLIDLAEKPLTIIYDSRKTAARPVTSGPSRHRPPMARYFSSRYSSSP